MRVSGSDLGVACLECFEAVLEVGLLSQPLQKLLPRKPCLFDIRYQKGFKCRSVYGALDVFVGVSTGFGCRV